MKSQMQINVVPSLTCPNCGALELIPSTANPDGSWREGARWAIRPFKVHDGESWKSQCLRCSGYLDEGYERTEKPADECGGGWF